MILSLNETRKPTSNNEMFFNEGLVMFEEMEVFLKNEATEGRNNRT